MVVTDVFKGLSNSHPLIESSEQYPPTKPTTQPPTHPPTHPPKRLGDLGLDLLSLQFFLPATLK